MARYIDLFNQNDVEDLRINFDKIMRILQRKAKRNFGRTVSLPVGNVADIDQPLMQEFVQKLRTQALLWLEHNKAYDTPNMFADFKVFSARNHVKRTDSAGFEIGGDWVTTYVFALRYFKQKPLVTLDDELEFPTLPEPEESNE